MSDQSTTSRRLVPWSQFAAAHGVTTRTLDRWVTREIIPGAQYINGRKYLPADVEPRRDDEPA
jgi:hypothetical protein